MSNKESLVNIWDPNNYNSEEVPALEVTQRMLIRKSASNNLTTTLAADGIAIFGQNPFDNHLTTADGEKAVVINATCIDTAEGKKLTTEYGSMIVDNNLTIGNNLEIENNVGIKGKLSVTELCPTNLDVQNDLEVLNKTYLRKNVIVGSGGVYDDQNKTNLEVYGDIKLCGTITTCGNEPIELIDLTATNLVSNNLEVNKSTLLQVTDDQNVNVDYTKNALCVRGKSQFLGNTVLLDNEGKDTSGPMLLIKNIPATNSGNRIAIQVEKGETELKQTEIAIDDKSIEALRVCNNLGTIVNFLGKDNQTRLKLDDSELTVKTKILANNSIDLTGDINLNKDGNVLVKNIKNITNSNPSREDDETIEISSTKDINITTHIDANVNIDSELIAKKNTTLEAKLNVSDTTTLSTTDESTDALIVNGSTQITNNLSVGGKLQVNGNFCTDRLRVERGIDFGNEKNSKTVFVNMGRLHSVCDVTDVPFSLSAIKPNNVVFRPAHSNDGNIKSDVYMGYYWNEDMGAITSPSDYPEYQHKPNEADSKRIPIKLVVTEEVDADFLNVKSNSNLGGTLDVVGDTTLNKDLDVEGVVTASQLVLSKNGNEFINFNETSLTLGKNINHRTEVKGDLNIAGSLSVSGIIYTSKHEDTIIQEDLSVHQLCYVEEQLKVDGNSVLNTVSMQELSVQKTANINGDLLVNGEIKGYGDNNVKIDSKISTTNDVWIGKNLTVSLKAISQYLSVGAATSTNDLEVKNRITTKELIVSDVLTLNSGLNVVAGCTTLKDTSILGDLSVTGNVDAGNITIGGKNLKSYLKSEAQLDCLSNLTVINTTNLEGNTTIGGEMTAKKSFSVVGKSSLKNTDIEGTLNINGSKVLINQHSLDVNNIKTNLEDTTIEGYLNITNSGTTSVTINQQGITSNNLTTDNLTVDNDTVINGNLTISNSSIELNNLGLTIIKPTTISNNLSVNGTANINKAVIENTLSIKQDLFVEGSIKTTNDFININNSTKISSDLSVGGNIEAENITIKQKSLKEYLRTEELTFLTKLTVEGDTCLGKTDISDNLTLIDPTRYLRVAGTTELNNTKILGDFEVSNSSVKINDQGLTVTKNTILNNTQITGDFKVDNSLVKIDDNGLTVNGTASLSDIDISGEINLDNKIVMNNQYVNIDSTTTIKKLNVLNEFSVFNSNLSIDSAGINNRSLTRLANTDIDGILNVTTDNVNIDNNIFEVKKQTKLNHLEITGNFELDNQAVKIDETGLTVKRQTNLASTRIDGDLTIDGKLILAGGVAQEDIHDIYVQSELSVADDAFIGNTLSVGLGIDNPVINTSNYTATNIVKKVDLIKTKEVNLSNQIDKLSDNIDITAVKALKVDRICLTTYNKINNQFEFINLKRNILWTKNNLTSISAKINQRNQNQALFIGELSSIVQDPINKDNVYIVLSYSDKSTKCILFLKYNLIKNELEVLLDNIDNSIIQLSNVHSQSLLVWENNLLAVSKSNQSILFYGIDLQFINTSKFIEDSENEKYKFEIKISTISSFITQNISNFTNIKIEHVKLNEYHVVLEIDEQYLVAYKIILNLNNVSNSDRQYLGHININSEYLSLNHQLNKNQITNNYRLEGISNRNIVFKQYIKEDKSQDSDDYLSYISYTYSDVNERYFPDLTSAAVKVKFTDKNSSDDLPDYLSLSSIKHSEFNNDIRLSGLRQRTDTLEHTSNTYNYMDSTLIDVRNAVQFESIPDLMTQKNGIQFFSDEHLTLTRTKESVIITPNIGIITVEDTNVLMEKDLDVSGSIDIKGNARIHNTLDILDDINVNNNINVENSIKVTNTVQTNNLEINSLMQNSVPFIDSENKIASSNNISWDNQNNLLKINNGLNPSEPGDFANTSGLSSKGNLTNRGNIINTADIFNQNNTYNIKSMFVGGTLRVGGITENKTNITDNIDEFNKTNYNGDLIPDTSIYKTGIHTIENKPLYITDSTFINGGLDIVRSSSREDLSSNNRLSRSNTTLTITGNTKIFNGDLDIVGNNIDKTPIQTITPIGNNNLLSSGYAKIIDKSSGKVVNTGNINVDGMLRAGLHYNLYEKLTKDLDYKTHTDFDNLPINLEENKDNIQYLKGKKDNNSYFSASNLISGRFNDIYGNTLIERRHSDLVFPMTNNTKKIDINLRDDSTTEIIESNIIKNNKSLSRIHSYIGWKENSTHKLKSSQFKEAPHEFIRLKNNGDTENFALDISSDKVEGKLDLFAQTVTIGGKNRNSNIIEETPVNNIREYFSNEHLSEFYPDIGSGLIITKKPETGLGFPAGEINVTFDSISRIGILTPTLKAKINEIGNVVIETVNPGKGWKNTDEINYTVEFIPEDGDLEKQFTYTSQNIKNNDLPSIPVSFKNEDESLKLVLLELEFTVDSNGRMKSFFANNMSNLQIDKYDKLTISIGSNMGLSDKNSLEIINKNNFNIVSGNLDINSQKDIQISATENLNIQNNNGKTAIKITNNDKGQLIIDSEKTIMINNNSDNHILDLSNPTDWEESKYPDGQTMEFINKNAENFENSTNIGGIVGKLVHNKEINNDSYKRFFYSWANDIKGTEGNADLQDKYIQGFNHYDSSNLNKKHNPYSLVNAWDSDSINYVSKPKFNISGLPATVDLKNSLSDSDFYSLGGFNVSTTKMYDQTRNDNHVLRTAKQNIKLDLSLTGDMVFTDSVKARNNYRFNNSTISTDNSQDLETYVDSSGFSFEYNTKISEQNKEISSNEVEKAEFKEIYRVDISSEPLFTFKVPVVKCIEESTIDVISDKNSVFNINNEWTDEINKTIIRKKQLDKKANIHTVFYSSILNLLGNQSNNIEIYGDNITSQYGDNRRAIYERIIETDKEKTDANKTGGVIGKQTVNTLIGKTVYNHYFNYNSNSQRTFSNDDYKNLYEIRKRLGVYNKKNETSWLYEAFLTPGIGLMSFCKKNNINSTLYDIQNIVDENKIKKTIGYDGIVNDAFLVKKSAKLLGIKITIKDGSVIYRTPISNSGKVEYTMPTNFGTFIGVNIKKLNTRNNKEKLKEHLTSNDLDSYLNLLYGENKWNINKTNGEIDGVSIKPFLSSLEIYNKAEVDEEPITKDTVPHILNGKSVSSWSVPDNLKENYYVEAGETLLVNYEIRIDRGEKIYPDVILLPSINNTDPNFEKEIVIPQTLKKSFEKIKNCNIQCELIWENESDLKDTKEILDNSGLPDVNIVINEETELLD